jgi:hypothetical protein
MVTNPATAEACCTSEQLAGLREASEVQDAAVLVIE